MLKLAVFKHWLSFLIYLVYFAEVTMIHYCRSLVVCNTFKHACISLSPVVHYHIPNVNRCHFRKTCMFSGGAVTAGLAIYDTMQLIQCPVATWVVGQASSMGSLILAAGTPGMRNALPNSSIMVHQPLGGARVRTSYFYSYFKSNEYLAPLYMSIHIFITFYFYG